MNRLVAAAAIAILLHPVIARGADCNLNGQDDALDVANGRSPGMRFAYRRIDIDSPGNLLAGDLDGDALPDLVIKTSVSFNGGAGAFLPPVPLAVGDRVRLLALADLDGDRD